MRIGTEFITDLPLGTLTGTEPKENIVTGEAKNFVRLYMFLLVAFSSYFKKKIKATACKVVALLYVKPLTKLLYDLVRPNVRKTAEKWDPSLRVPKILKFAGL